MAIEKRASGEPLASYGTNSSYGRNSESIDNTAQSHNAIGNFIDDIENHPNIGEIPPFDTDRGFYKPAPDNGVIPPVRMPSIGDNPNGVIPPVRMPSIGELPQGGTLPDIGEIPPFNPIPGIGGMLPGKGEPKHEFPGIVTGPDGGTNPGGSYAPGSGSGTTSPDGGQPATGIGGGQPPVFTNPPTDPTGTGDDSVDEMTEIDDDGYEFN